MAATENNGAEVARLAASMANSHIGVEAFINALASEHPTLLGQIAKAVGIAVCRKTARDSLWKPYNKVTGGSTCMVDLRVQVAQGVGQYGDSLTLPTHAYHDGRLDCSTIIGAELMARQSLI